MKPSKEYLIPTAQQFVEWVESCLKILAKKPSNFLDNGKASGKNRVGVLLASKARMNMILARQLQAELLLEAKRQGKKLPALINLEEISDGLE